MIRAFKLHVFNVKYFQRIEICIIILNVIFRLAILYYEMRHLGQLCGTDTIYLTFKLLLRGLHICIFRKSLQYISAVLYFLYIYIRKHVFIVEPLEKQKR